jgi:hypothetical protein
MFLTLFGQANRSLFPGDVPSVFIPWFQALTMYSGVHHVAFPPMAMDKPRTGHPGGFRSAWSGITMNGSLQLVNCSCGIAPESAIKPLSSESGQKMTDESRPR